MLLDGAVYEAGYQAADNDKQAYQDVVYHPHSCRIMSLM